MDRTEKFLEGINRGKRIRIILRKDPDMKRASLQFVWSDGSNRKRWSPGLMIDSDPRNPERDETLLTALQLRDTREIGLVEGRLGIVMGNARRKVAEGRDLYSMMEAWGESYYHNKDTRYSYRTALGKFKAYLGTNPPPLEDIRKIHMQGFRKHVAETLDPTYGSHVLNRIKRFFSAMAESDVIAVNPGTKLSIKRPDVIVEALSEGQMEKIFDVTCLQVREWAHKNPYDGDKRGNVFLRALNAGIFEDVRNAFILNTLCGLRIGDLMRLTGAMIPAEERAFPWVASKTRRAYVIAPNSTGWAIIKRQREKYGSGILFPLPRSTDRTRILRGIGGVCEIIKDLMMFRIARHTFGSVLYSRSGDIYSTSKMMGHKKVDTTQRHYAKYDTKLADIAAGHLPEYGKKQA